MSNLPKEPQRVSGVITPSLVRTEPDDRKTLDALGKDVEDVRNSVASLQQALERAELRMQVRDDFKKTLQIDTNVATPTKVFAAVITGGRPLSGFKVLSVGGAGTTMTCSVNGDVPFTLAQGDSITNEIIWSLEFLVGTPGAGTSTIRLGAYLGR
jgi:hypothetical protein